MLEILINMWKWARLYIARAPFLFCMILWLVLVFSLSMEEALDKGMFYFTFSYVAPFILSGYCAVVILAIRKKYITFVDESTESKIKTLILLKVDRNGQVIEQGDLLWGEENRNVHRIRSYQSLSLIMTRGVISECFIRAPYQDLIVNIPIRLFVEIKDLFDWQEIYDKIILDANVDSLEDFIAHIFSEYNFPNEGIDAIAKDYVEGRINGFRLLAKLKEVLEFPNEAISNFGKVIIDINLPKIKATKRIPAEPECQLGSVC